MPANGLIVIARIKPGCEEQLRTALNRIGNDIKGKRRAPSSSEPHIDFPPSRTLHFARLAVLDDPDSGSDRKRLLLVTDYDGKWREHIAELTTLSSGLEALWGCCEGYSGPDGFPEFIRTHRVDPQAYYIAFRNETLDQIRHLLQLRRQFDRPAPKSGVTSLTGWLKRRCGDLGRLPLAGIDVLSIMGRHGPINTLLAARRVNATLDRIWWIWLFNRLTLNRPIAPKHRYSEAPVDTAADWVPAAPGDEVVSKAAWEGAPSEDLVSQNQLTLLTVVRPERLRQLQAVLALIDFYGRRLSSKGTLVGISTIHTVRWALVDDDRRLLMASNYDGTWESYIDEFAEMILSGLNAIWENSLGYPESGAQDVEALKHFLRSHQAPANVFYSAYPDGSLLNIVDGLEIESELPAQTAPTGLPALRPVPVAETS